MYPPFNVRTGGIFGVSVAVSSWHPTTRVFSLSRIEENKKTKKHTSVLMDLLFIHLLQWKETEAEIIQIYGVNESMKISLPLSNEYESELLHTI